MANTLKVHREYLAAISHLADKTQLTKLYQEVDTLEELIAVDKNSDLQLEIDQLLKKITKFEIATLLDNHLEYQTIYLEIKSGVGGDDAQDWVTILQTIYIKFCKIHDFKCDIVSQNFSESGLRNTTLLIYGLNAFNYLKTEIGIHRLVRISPFKSSDQRHTSFASIYVYPVLSDLIIDLKPQDLRIDTMRSSGAGGQHVNTTDSAVRIVHLPTGIKAECQNDRSQHKNKEGAITQLKAKLLTHLKDNRHKDYVQDQRAKIDQRFWGIHIRSYVFDKSLVNDHRLHLKLSLKKVLEGHIIDFIKGMLYLYKK